MNSTYSVACAECLPKWMVFGSSINISIDGTCEIFVVFHRVGRMRKERGISS